MSTATSERGQVSDNEIAEAGLAHVLHTLVDLAPVKTELDRIALHQLVTDGMGGIGQGAADDAVNDPTTYAAAKAEGAYDVPEPPPAPADPRDTEIADLKAQLAKQAEQDAQIAELRAQVDARAADPSAVPPPEGSEHTVPPVTGTSDVPG